MNSYKVVVSTLMQNEYEVEAESQEKAFEYVRERKDIFAPWDDEKWTQYTNSYLLKKDLEIIRILEESAGLKTAREKIINIINQETGENYESPRTVRRDE